MLFCFVGVAYAENSPEIIDNTVIEMQAGTVRGSVLDSNGLPVIGAAVQVQGTNHGVVTDVDGKFVLTNVNPGDRLFVSCLGYVSQTVNYSSRELTIVLVEDSTLLEETVVVGYGSVKKESLTGAIANIKSEDITSTKTESLINNIQGKMPGLLIRQKTGEPGTFDNMISIRGYGTPLIVIDGVTREGTDEFAQLNSEDIESISILKDASAAIYGMNAANGVIIVTTKQGVSQKARVTYSSMVGIKEATGMETTVDAYTFRVVSNERARNTRLTEPYTKDILEKYRLGEPGYVDHDNIAMYMNKFALQQQHSISVRGGNEGVRYFVTFGYNNDNGLLKSAVQKYNRYNFRSNVTADLAPGLTLNVNVSGNKNEQQQPREDFMWNFKTLMVNDRGYGVHPIGNDGSHFTTIPPEGKNPAALTDPNVDGYRRNEGLTYRASAELSYKVPFVKGLQLSALVSYDGSQRNNSSLQKSYSLYDYYTGNYATKFGEDSYTNSMTLNNKSYARLMANYNRSFGKHSFAATVAAEATSTRRDYLTGSRKYSDLFTNDILDQASAGTATNGGNRSYTRLAAFLGRINYDYDSRYLLELVGRYDGSYRYAPAKRWAFFPSASIGWRISQEDFIKDNLPWVSSLKLRASYGLSGSDTGSAFQYIAAYTMSSNNSYVFDGSNLTTGMVAPGVVSDKLSWVTSKIANVGLDFDFWNGKLSGTVEVFDRRNEGLLANRLQTVPDTFGATFPQENINSNRNFGFEFNVGTRGKIGNDLSYTVSANMTYARSQWLHYERGAFSSSWNKWTTTTQSGRYVGAYAMYEYDGQYTSLEEYETAPLMGGSMGNSVMLPGSYKIVDMNGDGIINSSDRSNYQSWGAGGNPPIQYGLTLALSYKGFDLTALFQGASGYRIVYHNDDVWGYGGRTNLTYLLTKFMDRWHPTVDGADPYDPATQWIAGTYPALRSQWANTTDNGSSYRINAWYPNATYLRLKSLELGYNIPKNLVRQIGLENAKVYVSGFNLLTFCDKLLKNSDPEREERDWQANLAYPLMKTYSVGINLTF